MTPRAASLGALVALIWGFNFVVADDAVAHVPPLLLVGLRYTLVFLCFVPFTRRGGMPWRFILLVGLLYGVVQFSGLFVGLHRGVSAGVAATLIQSQALITIVLARVLLRETFAVRQWAGLLIAAAGLVLIASSHSASAPLDGVLFVLLGAAGWAGSNIVLKKATGISAWGITVWQSVVPIAVMFLLSGIFESGQKHALVHMHSKTVLAIAYIALLSTGVGNFIWYRLIQQIGPSNTAPFSLLVPVVGVISGWAVLGERLGAREIAGILLSLAGLAVVMVRPALLFGLRRVRQAQGPA
jgi:O-acetylserine/cysteine efflux transporter